jgi:transposase
MLAPQEVQRMLALQAQGWGAKRISKELGCSRNTVREYLRSGGWKPMDVSGRAGVLAPHMAWLEQRLRQHKGNADVVRQELQRELGIAVSLRTVQRAVAPMRVALRAQAVAHVRFETAPGLQLQVDFGSTHVQVGEELTRVFLFVATLGYSRRTYVLLSLHERQSAWLLGLEGAFRHFGGVTHEVLIDNAKALVDEHNRQTREVKLNDRFRSFCSYWGVTPRACAPYRAQTKGKDERGVGYVKRNAIAGHTFASLDALQAHLDRWTREVADVRVHGTTGEPPIERFERDERQALRPLPSKAPFLQVRELVRRVHTDACIELDTNRYSVPWKLIGEQVSVVVADREVQVLYAGQEVARHAQSALRRSSVIERSHLAGIVGSQFVGSTRLAPPPAAAPAELQRDLVEYEALVGGGW